LSAGRRRVAVPPRWIANIDCSLSESAEAESAKRDATVVA
jgi:hypothetical protein